MRRADRRASRGGAAAPRGRRAPPRRSAAVAGAAGAREAMHRERRARWAADADAQGGWPRPGFAWVTRCLQDLVDDSTVVVNEYPIDRRHRRSTGRGASSASRTRAGSAGACRRARLQARRAGHDGDRARSATAPISSMSRRPATWPRPARAARLTVIFNNQQWEAVKQSALAVHPDGWAKSTGALPAERARPAPRYEEIVRAFDGHGERAETPSEVGPAFRARSPPCARAVRRWSTSLRRARE